MAIDRYEEALARYERLDFLGCFELLEPTLLELESAGKPPRPEILKLAILGLASGGAPDFALELFEKFRSYFPDVEEYQTLEARLLKNLAVAVLDRQFSSHFAAESQRLYQAQFEKFGGTYSGINAATASLLNGDEERARTLARKVVELLPEAPSDYWSSATLAEAHLVLGNYEEGGRELRRARGFSPSSDQIAVTYRQLSRIIAHRGVAPVTLEPILPGAIACYCGHLVHGIGRTAGIDPDDDRLLADQVRAILEAHRVEHLFGALACGADIIVAEEGLARGSKLHVILPFAVDHFRQISVEPAGVSWGERFDSALSRATSTTILVEDPRSNYDVLFRTSSRLSMGKARLLANRSGAPVFQVALWNGQRGLGGSGTASDIDQWGDSGGRTIVVTTPEPRRPVPSVRVAPPQPNDRFERSVKCLIFADLCGFSKLSETEMTKAYPVWTERLSRILERNKPHLNLVNTWGDAVYLVVDDVLVTAQCAVELSHACEGLADEIGVQHSLAFRVSAHVAPVLETFDQILEKRNYLGTHVNITSRMEPCTPPGTVYVTEEFAACLSLEKDSSYACQYAGNRELPKGAGAMRMYRLYDARGAQSKRVGAPA